MGANFALFMEKPLFMHFCDSSRLIGLNAKLKLDANTSTSVHTLLNCILKSHLPFGEVIVLFMSNVRIF